MNNYAKLQMWLRIAMWVLVITGIASGGFTYVGLTADGSTSKFVAVVRATISVVAALVLWKFLLENLYSCSKPEARNGMIIVAFIAVFVLMSLSSYYSLAGISAVRAQRYHQQMLLESASSKFDELITQKKREAGIKESLDTAERIFQLHSASEAKFGSISKKRGRPGPISSSLKTLSRGFSDLSERVAQQSDEIERLRYRGHRLLGEIRDIADDEELNIKEQNAMVQKRLNEMSDLLFQLKNSSVIDSVSKLIDQIDQLYFLTDNQLVLDTIKEPVEKIKLMLHEQISELKGREIKLERYRVLSGVDAIQQYFFYVWPEAATCLTIDLLLPVMMLIFINHVSKKVKTQTVEEVSHDSHDIYDSAESGKSTIADLLETRFNRHRKATGRQHAG